MNKLSFLALMSILLCIFSCEKSEEPSLGGYALHFCPRPCECIITQPMSLQHQSQPLYDRRPQTTMKAQDLLLWMVTGSDSLIQIKQFKDYSPAYYDISMQHNEKKFPLAEHNKRLEHLLDRDYRHQDTRSTSDGLAYMNLIHWEYRITGVKNFHIVATAPLFGQAAGTSLNRFFSIFEFRPKQIISYRTNSLVWGYRSKNKVETIDQWLALKPMAPPAIVFRLTETPPEVPTHVKFVSILETTDGKVLRDTTEVNLK